MMKKTLFAYETENEVEDEIVSDLDKMMKKDINCFSVGSIIWRDQVLSTLKITNHEHTKTRKNLQVTLSIHITKSDTAPKNMERLNQNTFTLNVYSTHLGKSRHGETHKHQLLIFYPKTETQVNQTFKIPYPLGGFLTFEVESGDTMHHYEFEMMQSIAATD